MQEDDRAALFAHGDVVIAHVGQFVGQLDQFVIVRGEQSHRASLGMVMQKLDHAPGDGQAVIRAGAAPDFVQDDQAARRAMVQDVGGLDHLNHEGALPGGQFVLCADAREDAIHRGQTGRLRRHVAADLRHEARSTPPGAYKSSCRSYWGR